MFALPAEQIREIRNDCEKIVKIHDDYSRYVSKETLEKMDDQVATSSFRGCQ